MNLNITIFFALVGKQGHKVEHLLVTWGRLIFFIFYFSISALTHSVKPSLGG
jgi:hypothetical protein